MFSSATSMRELVLTFDSLPCTCRHPSGRWNKALTGGTYVPFQTHGLATDLYCALDLEWGDTDYGSPYYIRWDFSTTTSANSALALYGVNSKNAGSFTGKLEVDGVGSWELSCSASLSYQSVGIYSTRILGGHTLVSGVSIPTGCTFPSPYDIISVGSYYSGKVTLRI